MTDNALMEAVRDGKVEKLAILFERHQFPLFNFFLRLTGNRAASEDLVQDVFMRILKYRATYQGEDKFTVWLYKIARNAHIDHLRKRKDAVALDQQIVEPASPLPGPADRTEREEEAALIAKAMAELSPRKQEILVLSRFQNLKYEEIAAVMKCEVGTVKVRVYRALRELSDRFFALSGERAS